MSILAGLTAGLVATTGITLAAPLTPVVTVAIPAVAPAPDAPGVVADVPVPDILFDDLPKSTSFVGNTSEAPLPLDAAPVVGRWADVAQTPLAADAPAIAQARFVSPVPYPIGGGFGMRFHPILHYWRMHNGVDMGGACGTPVVAMMDGVVARAGWHGGYGYLVTVDHGVVDGQRLVTNYAHLSLIGVRIGQPVAKAQALGEVGTTGLSTGCHLHFEVNRAGSYVDPGPYITGRPSPTNPGAIPDLTPDKPLPVPPPVAPSATPTPSAATPSPVTTPSATPTPSGTPTPTPTPSGTPTPTPSGTPTPTPSGTPTPTPATPTPTVTPTPTATPTSTPKPTASITPTTTPSTPSTPSSPSAPATPTDPLGSTAG